MTQVADLHEQWMQDEEYRKAYEALEPEFALIRAALTLALHTEGAKPCP